MSRIGEKIKRAREQKKISLKELGKKCGVSESYISEIESGKRVIMESMIRKIGNILEIELNESLLADDDTMLNEDMGKAASKEPLTSKKEILPEWESAFSNIIKDVPIYNIDMNKTLSFKHLPIIDKKVEGFNPEKLIYISLPDDTMAGFRMKKGDLVMVLLNSEFPGNKFCLIECEGKKEIRQIRKLDGTRVLVVSHYNEIKAETMDMREIKILGHCIRAELELN